MSAVKSTKPAAYHHRHHIREYTVIIDSDRHVWVNGEKVQELIVDGRHAIDDDQLTTTGITTATGRCQAMRSFSAGVRDTRKRATRQRSTRARWPGGRVSTVRAMSGRAKRSARARPWPGALTTTAST